MTPDQLTVALSEAHALAEKAVEGMKDGGSCCLDMVFIPSGKNHPIKRKTKVWDEAIENAGFSGHRTNSSWWKGYLISPRAGLQASTRLKACETMAEELRSRGWDACVYYTVD